MAGTLYLPSQDSSFVRRHFFQRLPILIFWLRQRHCSLKTFQHFIYATAIEAGLAK